MLMGYTGLIRGLGQGAQEDWTIRAMGGGGDMEPYPSQQM
jgi:hypothetical protein